MADPEKPPAEESLFAAMAEAEEQSRAAREQRLAVETSLTQLRQAIQRMEAVTTKLASAEPLLKAGMEQAAKAAFAKQASELVSTVERQVQNSINRLDGAVNRATHRLMPWTWILAASCSVPDLLASTATIASRNPSMTPGIPRPSSIKR